MQYVAFLRGINVGGNKKVEMAKLKKVLETMGCEKVKTLLNSGNAAFDAKEKNSTKLCAQIAAQLEKAFGFTIPVILRTRDGLAALQKTDPFKGIAVTKDIRQYVTFLSQKPQSAMKTYESPEKDFRILHVTDGEVVSVLDLSRGTGTIDAMAIVEKEFGKNVTTRNWNTVMKLLA